jgi:hypothetical protein
MNKSEFFQSIKGTYELGLAIIAKKNADYSSGDDPFRNFRSAEVVGISPDRAILVRMLDKMARLGNLLEKDPDVISESFEDTCLDLINYTAILKAYREDRRNPDEFYGESNLTPERVADNMRKNKEIYDGLDRLYGEDKNENKK